MGVYGHLHDQEDGPYRTDLYNNGELNSTENTMEYYMDNCTAITEILLTGFKVFHGFRIPMFVVFLVIYLLICCENVLIIYIIVSSTRLKALMFFIIQNMCIGDLLGISNIIPKFLNDVLCEVPSFTVTGCIVQLQIYGAKGEIGSFFYALMSYDRYLAVCHPLRYSSFVNNRLYLHTVIVFWTFAVVWSGIQYGLLSRLQFCGHNTIPHFFCDYYPFVNLATSDTRHVHLLNSVIIAFTILATILSVFVTYMCIIRTILKIPSASGRRKTFSTCSSHLMVFSMQYGLSLGVYVLPAKVVSVQLTNTFTFIHFVWTPLVNPMIYTFNNKEFRAECLRKMKRAERMF